MVPLQYPAELREEETSLGVVRVGVSVSKLVVQPVDPHPLVNAEVHGEPLTKEEKQAERPPGFVRLVRPKSVTSRSDR